ncbi:MAG: cupin domain-containing protein [Alphaproteobacteria bacterium]
MAFLTVQLPDAADAMAPDGSEVRLLCHTSRCSMAHFALPPGAISKAVAHHTVEEIWFILGGVGRMWRRLGEREEIVEVRQGASLVIPVGVHFQFRNDGDTTFAAVATTIPPWPGAEEAYFVDGVWTATEGL